MSRIQSAVFACFSRIHAERKRAERKHAERKFAERINAEVARAYRYAERHVRFLSLLGVVLIPALYPVDRFLFEPTYDTLGLRILGGSACAVCLFSDRAPLHRFAPYVWLSAVALIFTVMLPSMLTLNAATTPVGGDVHIGWTTSYLVGLFCFVLVMNGWLVSLLSWLVGSIIAVTLVLTVANPNWQLVFDSFVVPTGIWLSAILVGSYANRSLCVVESSKTRTARAVAGNLAHELRTPLSGIVARARGAHTMIPELWEGYRGVAREEQEPSLSEAEIAEAGSRLLAIAEEARFANTVISLLLDEAVSRRGWTLEPETISMAQVLGEVLEEQPCSGSDRYGALSVDSAEDFTFRASRLICRYVLKSLLEAASAAGSIVEIKISARTTPTQLGVVCLTLDPGEEPEDGEDCEDGRRGGAATTREADDEMEVSRRMLRELHGEVLTTRKDRALSTISLRILRNSKG